MLDKEAAEAARKVIDGTPNYVDVLEPTVICWGRAGIGFGEVVFYKENGKLKCDNEGMSKEFIKEVLNDLVEQSEFISVRPK